MNTRSTEQALRTLSSSSSLSTHCGILNSGARRGLPLTVAMTTPLHPSNHLSFSKGPLLVTAATSPLSPNPHLSPHLPPGLPSHPRASLAPPPALLPGLIYTLSSCVAPHPGPVLPQRSPSGPCLLPTFCRTPLSCPHTGICHKVPERAKLKVSPGSGENPDPDQESRALPSGLGGKGEGL